MASITNGLIEKVNIDNNQISHSIASTAYGICGTRANEAAKTVEMTGFQLLEGVTIHIQFSNNNTATSPTLNVNNTGAHPITLYGGTAAGTDDETSGWYSGAILSLTYDGTSWVRDYGYNTNTNTDTNVSQLEVNSNQEYPILLKHNATGIDETSTTNYSTDVTINPSTGTLTALSFSGSGEGLTDIPLEGLTVGTLVTVADREWELGDTISASTLRQDLNLSNALHFLGVTTTQMEDGMSGIAPDQTGKVTIDGAEVTPEPGDVVLASDDHQEYLWTGFLWELLGQDASIARTFTISQYDRISSISQATDRTITVSTESIGVLPVSHGGTGLGTLTEGYALIGKGANQDEVELRAILNNTQAAAVTIPDNSLITANTFYYGLPLINGVHNYDSTTSIYAPISGGDANHVLIGSTTGIPVWTASVTISSAISTTADEAAWDILTLGNENSISGVSPHSEGKIILYSQNIGSHTILGETTTTDYTHTLSKQSGWIVSGASAGVATNGDTLMYLSDQGILSASNTTVGSNVQPVYLNAGVLTPLTYTPNRLYYSAAVQQGETDSTSFIATDHYASATKIAINSTTAPDTNVTLYVNGNTTIGGNLIPSITAGTDPAGYTLGSDTNRWAKLYIGTTDSHGEYGKPIYWNEGAPAATYPVQYLTWTIASGQTSTGSITKSGKIFADSYVLSLVVTSGENYLNGPLTWTTNTDTLTIATSVATSGAVSGYALLARGDSLD